MKHPRPLLLLLAVLLESCGEPSDPGTPAPSSGAAAGPGLALTWEAERGPVHVGVRLEPGEPRLSDEPELTLTITAAEGIVVHLPPFGSALGAFLIRDFHEPLPTFENGQQILQQVYRLEPVLVGDQTILPITVAFEDQRAGREGGHHEVTTDPQGVTVVSMIEAEAPTLADLRPAAEPLEIPPEPLSLTGLWIGLGVLALLVAAFLWSRSRPHRVRPEHLLSPTELALLELRRLLADDLLQKGEVKTYYLELTAIVRRHVERSTGIRAPEQTTLEFLRAMHRSDAIPAERQAKLGAFLEAADLVKFAAFQPGGEEIEQSLTRAKEFVGLGSAILRPTSDQEAAA